jgi:hypothetical protein
MTKYIVKEGKALSTLRGIIGHPKDINNVKEKEFISAKDIATGETGFSKLLSLDNSPIEEYKSKVVKKGAVKKEVQKEKKEEPEKEEPEKDK